MYACHAVISLITSLHAVRTMLEAIISFLPTEGGGAIGALNWTSEERKRLAVQVGGEGHMWIALNVRQEISCSLCLGVL